MKFNGWQRLVAEYAKQFAAEHPTGLLKRLNSPESRRIHDKEK
jgi:hypothetical protein